MLLIVDALVEGPAIGSTRALCASQGDRNIHHPVFSWRKPLCRPFHMTAFSSFKRSPLRDYFPPPSNTEHGITADEGAMMFARYTCTDEV